MAEQVKARPPKKRFDDVPDSIKELTNFFDSSLQNVTKVDGSSPKERHKQLEKERKQKKKKKKVVIRVKPISVASRPETKTKGHDETPRPAKSTDRVKDLRAMHRLRSAMLTATVRIAQEEYGDRNILGAGDAGKMLIGIPIPLAMQYVIQNNVWPLGRMIQLVGIEKSNKSSLGFEVTRWFSECGGVCNLLENETKYAEDLAQSIFGYADELAAEYGGTGEVLTHYPCGTLQDWQQKLTTATQGWKDIMTKGVKADKKKKIVAVPPMGRTFPVLLLLDSIAGGVSEEKQIKMDKRGYAERDYAIEALLNQEFLKKYRTDLIGWPFSLLVVNHLKKQKAEQGGYIERKKPGGKHIGFQESLELEMSRVTSLKYVDDRPEAVAMDIRGNRIKIQCQKSAMGEEERFVQVNLVWWYDRSEKDGKLRQRSQWQWEAATIDLLLGLEGSRKDKAQGIIDLHKKSETEIWSRRLGVSKERPLNKQQIGLLLEQDAGIVDQLTDLFAIKRRTVFHYGDDYRKLLGQVSAKKQKKLND